MTEKDACSDPGVDLTKVEGALNGRIAPGALTEAEQEVYFDKLAASYWAPNSIEDAYFEELRRRGGGVGMDEAGNLVFGTTRLP